MDFWHDNWMGTGALCGKVEIFSDHVVADFVAGGTWNVVMFRQHLDAELVGRVLQVAPPTFRGPDHMVWTRTASSTFSTSSAYSLVRQGNNRSWISAYVWQLGLPIKISFCMMRLLQGRLSTMDKLRRFGVCGPSRCWCCRDPQEEDLDNVFGSREGARLVWRYFKIRPERLLLPHVEEDGGSAAGRGRQHRLGRTSGVDGFLA
ncbi:uncharacterized protein [Coffea arabica]|uniref:Reverse transcriptase zinc-binding domain-containing protein n=1 Tax=Coffea arabica TaxID=13443 RepID=A0ABM4VSX4_COFAR